MYGKSLTTAMLAALLTIACTGAEDSPAPADQDEPREQTAEGAAAPGATGDEPARRAPAETPQARPGRGMPMGGGMAEMHARMMGGGSPDDAPEAVAAAASSPDCPDVSQDLVDRGREVWSGPGNCYTCHGGDATGSQLAPDLTDDEWLNMDGSYGSIAEVVRSGVTRPRQYPAPMPPMGGGDLSEEQVCAAAAYVYSLSH